MEKCLSASRDRVFAALERKIPDRIPIGEWTIDTRVIQKIHPSLTYEDFVEQYDLDFVCARENQILQRIDEKCFLDEWGVMKKSMGEAVLLPTKPAVQSLQDLERLVIPNVNASHRLEDLKRIVRRFKGRKAIVFVMHAVFIDAVHLRGMEGFLTDIYENPQLVDRILDIVTAYNFQLGLRAIREGAEILVFGDDYASAHGPLMSPKHFETLIFPRLRKFVDRYKAEGGYCVKHSDGNIWSLLDAIVNLGFDAINPIDPIAGMDIEKVKGMYGNRVCLIGNIDCGELLSNGSPEEVEDVVKDCIKKAGQGGGYILSSSNTIHSGVKPENFLAMIGAGRKYGQYPLTLS